MKIQQFKQKASLEQIDALNYFPLSRKIVSDQGDIREKIYKYSGIFDANVAKTTILKKSGNNN